MLTKVLKAAGAAAAAAARPEKPPRDQVEPVAIDLVRRHGPEIMAVARRHSCTPEDAEDAYQRGLEILLTKAPSTSPGHLLPWLKTVVKHEAYALHRARERAGQPTPADRLAATRLTAPPDDQAEQHERLQIGAEALARLKPHEIRCILLLAEGHTYKQIQELTGFSYTKVNRCLSEGRRTFLRRVEGIESGEECERLAPLLSALADGEASAKDMAALRPHLRTCLACRATLRDAREVPARVAALAPIGLLAGGHATVVGGGASGGGLLAGLRSAWDALTDRLLSMALRGQELIETASSHKLAAAAASAAALGGGGIATVEVSGHAPGDSHSRPPTVVATRAVPRAPAWRTAALVTGRSGTGGAAAAGQSGSAIAAAAARDAARAGAEAHGATRRGPARVVHPRKRPARPHSPEMPLVVPEPAYAAPVPAAAPASSEVSPEPKADPPDRPRGSTGEFGP